MTKVLLFPNETRDPGFAITRSVHALLERRGCHCVCIPEAPMPQLPCEDAQSAADASFILCVGGDGTMLRAVSLEAVGALPVAGVNMGQRGYLAQYEPGDSAALAALAEGRYQLSRRLMLTAECRDENGQLRSLTALNDIVISRSEAAQTVTLDVSADGQSLSAFMADGVLIATATGSTAYNVSAGGPVMDAEVDALIVTPVCPHTIWARSYILTADRLVTISLKRHGAGLSADGGAPVRLSEGAEVRIQRSPRSALLIVPEGKPLLCDVHRKLL